MMAHRLCAIQNVLNNIYLSGSKSVRSFSVHPVCCIKYVDKIVLTDDGTTFVAWHPKKDFPYECTRPLPDTSEKDNGSVLKNILSKHAFKSPHPEIARQELIRITHTSKHRWFPRSRDKRAKKTPMDREFL